MIDDAAVIYPQGYLNNLTGETLVQECTAVIEKGTRKIIISFRDTELVNSIGISMLLLIIEKLISTDGQLCFTDMNQTLQDTFVMLGLTHYISCFTHEQDALLYLRTVSLS